MTPLRGLIVSLSIFVCAWAPMVLLSLPVVAVMLCTEWNGKTTWFGNYLYGRAGNTHMPANPTMFDQWWFLAIRNPVSNFGKFTLSTAPDNKWAWLIDCRLIGRLHLIYGWKNPDPRLPGSRRPFVFRFWFHD